VLLPLLLQGKLLLAQYWLLLLLLLPCCEAGGVGLLLRLAC
jgi:hypothetical protein